MVSDTIQPRSRPTNAVINSIIDGIDRENIEHRFKLLTKTLLTKWFNTVSLDNDDLQNIIDGVEGNIGTELLRHFGMLFGMMDLVIDGYFIDDEQNPMYFIDDNVITSTVIPFITNTHSTINHALTPFTETDKNNTFIEYIEAILYWYGRPYLIEWCRLVITIDDVVNDLTINVINRNNCE